VEAAAAGAALREAKQWMVDHMERSEGRCGDLSRNDEFDLCADRSRACAGKIRLRGERIKEFSNFEIEEEDHNSVAAVRFNPIWDTCIAMVALEEAGVAPDHPSLVKAADWILSRQISRRRRLAGQE